jgi:hypothetical protein
MAQTRRHPTLYPRAAVILATVINLVTGLG